MILEFWSFPITDLKDEQCLSEWLHLTPSFLNYSCRHEFWLYRIHVELVSWNVRIGRTLICPNPHSGLIVVLTVNLASKPYTLCTHPILPCSLFHIGWDNLLDCTLQMSPARMFDLWNESKIMSIKVSSKTIFLNLQVNLLT